jgi:hypothetical protein
MVIQGLVDGIQLIVVMYTMQRHFENDGVPIVSRGEFDIIDGDSGMLILTVDTTRLQEEVYASKQDCMQCTFIATNGSSMVGERLPPEFATSVMYSSENQNHVWEAAMPAWTSWQQDPQKCVDIMASLIDDVGSLQKVQLIKNDILEVYYSWFRHLIKLADAFQICSWANDLLIEVETMESASLEMLSEKANDVLVKIQSQIIHTMCTIRVLRTLSESCSGLNEECLESWSESWCSVMRGSLKIVSVYKDNAANDLLIQVLTSFAFMIVKPIPGFYPQHEKLWQLSVEADYQFALFREIESSLSNIQVCSH